MSSPESLRQPPRMGPAGLPRRISRHAAGESLRLLLHEPVRVDVELPQCGPDATVVAHTDLLSSKQGVFEDRPLQALGNGVFRWEPTTTRTGVYHYRLRYRRNAEEPWLQEPYPYGRILVDPPAVQDLRLYTLIPRVSGSMRQWGERLQAIADLGFNAVHILPITRRGDSMSPYSAADWFDIDPAWVDSTDTRSARAQLDAFVDRARSLNIRLCMDLVLNHVSVGSPITDRHPDWFVPDPQESDGLKRAGFWAGSRWHKWQDLALLDHDHPDQTVRDELWATLLEYGETWAGVAAATGGLIRLDNAHSTPEPLLAFLLKHLREQFNDLGILAELFCDFDRAERLVWEHGLNLLLATPWETPYASSLRDYLGFLHRVGNSVRHLVPVISADSGSVAQEYGTADATGPRYALTALLGTGCSGAVQGTETGVGKRIEFIGEPVDEPVGTQPQHEAIQSIHRYLAEHPDVFGATNNVRFVDHGHGAVIAAIRTDGAGQNAFLVAANLDTVNEHRLRIHELPDALVLPPCGWTVRRLSTD